jgi:hypothetical protein
VFSHSQWILMPCYDTSYLGSLTTMVQSCLLVVLPAYVFFMVQMKSFLSWLGSGRSIK